MKVVLIRVTVFGVIFFAIVAAITSVVVGFGLAIAYALTLIIANLEMPEALTSGTVFAVASLYLCFQFFTHTINERNLSRLCNDCAEKEKHENEHTTPPQEPFAFTTIRTKKPKTRQTHTK